MIVEALAMLGGVLVVIACARAWMAKTADLNLSLFRPYRGDPWPVGVQEDDDFHFNWKPATATTFAASSDLTEAGSIADALDGSVAAARVGQIRVRRIGR